MFDEPDRIILRGAQYRRIVQGQGANQILGRGYHRCKGALSGLACAVDGDHARVSQCLSDHDPGFPGDESGSCGAWHSRIVPRVCACGRHLYARLVGYQCTSSRHRQGHPVAVGSAQRDPSSVSPAASIAAWECMDRCETRPFTGTTTRQLAPESTSAPGNKPVGSAVKMVSNLSGPGSTLS